MKFSRTGNRLTQFACALPLLFAIAACGSDGDGGGRTVPAAAPLEGQFVDGPVAGLEYKTATILGITDSNGKFKYLEGETIEFSIGGVRLGSATAATTLTPVSLVPAATNELNSQVTNIAQLLQSIDDDGLLENGIQISDRMRSAAQGRTIQFDQTAVVFATDPAVNQFVTALTVASLAGSRPMQSRIDAQAHLRETLSAQSGTNCPAPTCMQITQMWSSQFANITTNGFSQTETSAGHQGNISKYILMGARDDGTAHFRVAVSAQGNTSNALVRLGVVVADEIVLIGESYPLSTGLMDLVIDLKKELPAAAARSEKALDFFVMTGIDKNSNSALDNDNNAGEVTTVSIWRFRVIPQWRYDASLSSLSTTFFFGALFVPMAEDFATTFTTGKGPSYFPPRTQVPLNSIESKWADIRATYTTSEPRIFDPLTELYPLSHKVGIDYENPSGVVGGYSFPSSSSVADSVVASTLVKEKIVAKLLTAISTGSLQTATSVSKSLRTAERFDGTELNLLLSFGTVYLDATVTTDITCSNNVAKVSNVKLTGQLWDLYDWNYSSNPPTPELRPTFGALAMVQAGYGSLGRGGMVYQVQVALDSSLSQYEGTTVGTCQSAPPPPTDTSIAGAWAVSDTATISCNGSFGSGSDTQTATGNVTITQNGRNISFISPINTQRTGTITGDTVQVTGALALGADGVTFTQNRIDFTGTIASGGRRIDLSGNGVASGSYLGSPGSCTASSTQIFTR